MAQLFLYDYHAEELAPQVRDDIRAWIETSPHRTSSRAKRQGWEGETARAQRLCMRIATAAGRGQQGCPQKGPEACGGRPARCMVAAMTARTGEGLVLSAVAFGERDVLARVLCPERGVVSGLVKGGRGKAATLQPFNTVGYEHFRRLERQLGTLTLDLRVSRAARWLGDMGGGYMAAYLSEVLCAVLPEEHPYEGLMERVAALVESRADWQAVVAFEMYLLDVVGYGLRLEDVVAGEGDAAYVSPASGRAVTRGAAVGWEARLLPLPHCMGGPECGEVEDFLSAWRLTGHFLAKALHGKSLAARGRLADHLVRGMRRDDVLAA